MHKNTQEDILVNRQILQREIKSDSRSFNIIISLSPVLY